MKIGIALTLGVAAVVAAVCVVGCRERVDAVAPSPAGAAGRAGAALDTAAGKTAAAATNLANKAAPAIGAAGEAVQQAGAAAERTSEDMLK